MAGTFLQTSLIWTAYAVATGLALIASVVTCLTFRKPGENSAVVNIVAIISLTSLLATVLLLPVDIALISSTTSPLGVKHDWATPQHVADIIHTLKIVYYSLYSLDGLLCLVVIPFSYFWYEEYDEVEEEMGDKTFWGKLWGACKYTSFFILFVALLFLIGFFVPAASSHKGEHLDLDFFKKLLAEGNLEKALTFGVGLLIVVGILLYVLYTAPGMALIPVRIMKSAPSLAAPKLASTIALDLEQNRERQRMLEMRNSGRDEPMPSQDRRELDLLRREERKLVRRDRLASEARGEGHGTFHQAWNKIRAVFRPISMLGGMLLLIVVLVVWASMLITGVDKAKNSSCKAHCGYILAHIHLFQPMNWIFMRAANAFPADYIFMALLVLLFFASSVSGIASFGIRVLWVRIFQIRRGRTAPQALLIATVMLALIILAINYAVAMLVVPQYATYGTQVFCTADPRLPGLLPDCSGEREEMLRPCSETLTSDRAKDVCTGSVMTTFLNRVTLNWPVFGAAAFWSQFAFLLVFLTVLAVELVRPRRLSLEEIDAEAEADEEENLLAGSSGGRRRYGSVGEDGTARETGITW